MGFEQPFDEEFQEFPLRHLKQVDCGNNLTSFTEIYSCYEPTKKADIPGEGEGNFCKVQSGGGLLHDNRNVISDLVDKEYVGPGVAVCSISSKYFGLYYPRRSVVPFEDTYSSILDSSPRRQVSIGPNHQAEVPVWDPQVVGKYYSGSDGVVNAYGGKLMGACILPMPDPELSAHSDVAGVNAGDGRKDCLCRDQGSVRCVGQHARKAREWVRETLGHEKFVQLGFCEMGEEVSQKWTEEEEHAFHEVVYSNPESHGKNFWEHLSMVFPSRTKKEIASYFFNVFMLRRRAFQNRSHFLDIDSDDDDDDWQGGNGSPFGVAQDDEDSAIESLVAEDDFPDGNGDVENGGGTSTENDGGRSLLSNAQICTSLEGFGSEFVVHHVSKILGGDGEKFDAQNVSRVGFEYQAKPLTHLVQLIQGQLCSKRGVKSDRKEGLHVNDDCLGSGCLLEPCDSKVWDAKYPMSPLKAVVDLPPTRNMIEEILAWALRTTASQVMRKALCKDLLNLFFLFHSIKFEHAACCEGQECKLPKKINFS